MSNRMVIVIVLLSGQLLLTGCVSFAETPGERFRQAIKEIEAACAKRKLDPNEVCGGVAKLKPADPLATEEGRFAHSIKIPNPVPEDSGYKSGMTPEQYFDHLCKTEAGEFIFKTVENVEGVIQLRPRVKANYEHSHLYALEDPFGFEASKGFYVSPSGYKSYEIPAVASETQELKYTRYFGYDGRSIETLRSIPDSHRKSRYGYTWRGVIRPHDRENGIGGGEVIVVDLETNEVLAVHRGYAQYKMDERAGPLNAGWRKRCPPIQPTGGPYGHFILKVLKPGIATLPTAGGNNATK